MARGPSKGWACFEVEKGDGMVWPHDLSSKHDSMWAWLYGRNPVRPNPNFYVAKLAMTQLIMGL